MRSDLFTGEIHSVCCEDGTVYHISYYLAHEFPGYRLKYRIDGKKLYANVVLPNGASAEVVYSFTRLSPGDAGYETEPLRNIPVRLLPLLSWYVDEEGSIHLVLSLICDAPRLAGPGARHMDAIVKAIEDAWD